jgi:hypothetical protein
MTREEHMNWCKERALAYVAEGDYGSAVASMLSDLAKHPETEASSRGACAQMGMLLLMNGLTDDGATRFIKGFN